jgi:hypothetical protein
MPFPFKHSNRSKQALNEAAIERAAVTPSASQQSFSSGSGEGRSTTQHQTSTTTTTAPSHTYEQPYDPRHPDVASRAAAYQSPGGSPPPSLKTRYQHTYSQEASPASPSPAGSSADDLVLDTQRLVNQGRRHTSHSPAVEHKKRSIFDRMRGTNSHRSSELKSHPPAATQGSYNNNSGGLARRLSRRHDGPPIIRTSQQRDSGEQHQRADWQPAAQDSRSHLPSPQEGPEDNGLDPYLITDPEEDTPQSPHSSTQLRVPRQKLNTIRAVQSDSESPLYSAESQNTSPDHQYQHSSNQGYYHRSPDSAKQYQSPDSVLSYQTQDSAQQYQYQLPEQTHSQQQLNSLPSSPTSQYHDQDYTQDSATQQEDTPLHYRNEQRPGSVQSNNQSPTSIHHANRSEYPERTTSIQGPIQGLLNTRPLSQHLHMAPSSSTQQNRRSTDSKQLIQAMAQSDSRDPPAYRQQQQFNSSQPSQPSGLSPMPPASQGQNYRGGPPQRDQYNPSGGGEQGRSTPPPAPGDRDVNEAYKELRRCFLSKDPRVPLTALKFRNIRRSKGFTSTRQHRSKLCRVKLSNYKIHWPTNDYHNRAPPLTIVNTYHDFKDWMEPSRISLSISEKIGGQYHHGYHNL